MKGFWKRFVCLVLVAILAVPMTFHTASAASLPKLNKTSLTLNGVGMTYTLKVKNEPANTTLTWSSSDTDVATVNALGQVTGMSKGKAVVTCLVTYSDKSIVKLTCKITVKVPATAVSISNAQLKNNTHEMIVGQTYDFNRKLTPSNSSDKTYWIIKDEDIATVDKNGVVTAVKQGTTQLEARTGKNKTAAMDPLNTVTHSINITITEPVAEVTEVKKTDDKTLTIKFSAAMKKASLINASGSLNTGNITIEGKKVNNVTAADLGVITPNLTTDGLTLTLKTTNKFDGVYSVKIENDCLTESGIAFKGYDQELDFSDTLIPAITAATVDDTGFVANILFNKEVDISGLTVTVADTTLNPTTQLLLTTASNYKLKADKKTLQLDLSGIAYADYNKQLHIYISGIKDLKGNFTQPYNNDIYLYTDNSQKPNATLSYVKRTSKTTITAYFSKAIQNGGYMTLNNVTVYGAVDSNDKTAVNYTIMDSTITNATGYLNGTITGWNSYNTLMPASAVNFVVDMSVGAAAPTITNYQMTTTMNNNTPVNTIVITYNKDVTLPVNTGVLSAVYRDANSNIIPYYITYGATAKGNVVTILIDPSTTIGTGIYTVTLDTGFVYDSYKNNSDKTTLTLSASATSTAQFPAPTEIRQDKDNPSIIYVNFPKKVDLASAQTPSNYSFDTVHPYSAYVTSNSDAGATVQLTFTPGALRYTSNYPVTIENVSGYSGSYQPMAKYYKLQQFNENAAPKFQYARLNGNTITMYFDEAIQGTVVLNIYSGGNLITLNSSTSYYIQDNTIVIVLAQAVSSTNLYIIPQSGCSIKDAAGNSATLASQIPVN